VANVAGMSRRHRIHVDDLPLHIVQRGHSRRPCFLADADRRAYLRCLEVALGDARCALHAYVLMTNHVHLLVTPSEAARVPGLLVALGRRYVQYFNTTHGRSGTLWEGRYRSSLVDSDAYLIACMRYIELNPVRAGIVSDPAAYRWSSYGANALGTGDALVRSHPTYDALGADDVVRRVAYRSLFRDEPADTLGIIRESLARGAPLGSRQFLASVERMLGRRCVPRPPGRPPRTSAAVIEPGSVIPVIPSAR
jgi:putative transposase